MSRQFSRKRSVLAVACEQFESRRLLTPFSGPWPEIRELTLSFAPDGTNVSNQSSRLSELLNTVGQESDWQQEILRAFQTWAVTSNINIGLKTDTGADFGGLGLKQGDPRYGDIRIGSLSLADDVLAVADPYDPFIANTWVGDVFLNSNISFNIGGDGDGFDLYTVMLHEAGHVFGVLHNPDPSSPMYPYFQRVFTGQLHPDDLTLLHQLYGERSPDEFDATGDNGSLATATGLNLTGEDSEIGTAFEADLTTASDVDIYRFTVPTGTDTLHIGLEAYGLSLLTSRITLLSADGRELQTTVTTDPLNNDLSMDLSGLTAGESYYLRVESASDDVFGIGSYEISISPSAADSHHEEDVPPPMSEPLLLDTTPGYVEYTYYEIEGTIDSAHPVQSFIVKSADLGPGMTNVFTIVVKTLDSSGKELNIRVKDPDGKEVESNLLYKSSGIIEVQIPSVDSYADYTVDVYTDEPILGEIPFEIEVDFDQDGTHLQTFFGDWISSEQTSHTQTLTVLESQQFHFSLGASDYNLPGETGGRMEIVDEQGRTVFVLEARDGSTRAADVFLAKGTYTVRFSRANGDSSNPLYYSLMGSVQSTPIGPQLRDTTLDPARPKQNDVEGDLTFYWSAEPTKSSSPSLAGVGAIVNTPTNSVQLFQSSSQLSISPSMLAPDVTGGIGGVATESTTTDAVRGVQARRSSDLSVDSGRELGLSTSKESSATGSILPGLLAFKSQDGESQAIGSDRILDYFSQLWSADEANEHLAANSGPTDTADSDAAMFAQLGNAVLSPAVRLLQSAAGVSAFAIVSIVYCVGSPREFFSRLQGSAVETLKFSRGFWIRRRKPAVPRLSEDKI
ncbi:MAG: matrixin family metalloprotease [Planctomycetaceae bacterium]|nr:matrixin family metalloprotease [Planctomycetaceae bacterium]